MNISADVSPGNILIRADASPEIGTGHIMRCLALAQAWQDAGGEATFLMAQSTPSIEARLAAENCKVIPVSALSGGNEDADLTNKSASRTEAEWLIVDGYAFGTRYQEQLRNHERKLLCVDDAGKCDHYVADIVLNQNLTASEKDYPHCRPGTQLLLGPSFCLLRREFGPWRKWRRKSSGMGHNVLVTLGGSTPVDVGVHVMESLGRAKIEGLRAIFVVGGSSMGVAALEACSAKLPEYISLRRDVSNMAELMGWADLAISAAGSTCWELCLLGLPSILLDVADNQIPIAIELERRGCALYLGNGNCVSQHDMANSVENLLASQETRQSMSRHSRQLVDGLGAVRAVSAMRGIVCASHSADTRRATA
ncbi:MAG: UDP-2,4-diacetamido-2,4,6-trideoxy-beta-L-altropyranose hydrolase [Terriglobales bacterium]